MDLVAAKPSWGRQGGAFALDFDAERSVSDASFACRPRVPPATISDA